MKFLHFLTLIFSSVFLLSVRSDVALASYAGQARVFKIMLDPAGDASHPGRIIEDAFERTITLELAHALAHQIEQLAPNTRVIITRTGNETIRPHQNANFANRLDVDLFISLHCYQEQQPRPQLAIYTFSYGDYTPSRIQDLAFYPYDQAYLLAGGTTQKYAQAIEATLKQYAKQFDLVGAFGIPFKPLIGVKAPAIGIELGLKNKQGWQSFIAPLAQAVVGIVGAGA